MATAYIGLGANLGNREANLRIALRGLTRMARVDAVSSLYETAPVGAPLPKYYNAACRVETGLEPIALFRFLKALEHEIGRRPSGERFEPRPIDLDLLLYADQVIETPDLTVPHPPMLQRAFVMTPLAEIAPELELDGRSAAQIAEALGTGGLTRIQPVGWDGVASSTQDVRL